MEGGEVVGEGEVVAWLAHDSEPCQEGGKTEREGEKGEEGENSFSPPLCLQALHQLLITNSAHPLSLFLSLFRSLPLSSSISPCFYLSSPLSFTHILYSFLSLTHILSISFSLYFCLPLSHLSLPSQYLTKSVSFSLPPLSVPSLPHSLFSFLTQQTFHIRSE